VGGRCFLEAARLGIGTLLGVDPDAYGEDSWQTQPATRADADQDKAWSLAERAHDIAASVNIHAAVGFAQELPLRVLHQADLFVLAGDNLELLVWAGNMAASLQKVLIQGAVHGETWTSFVRVWDLRKPESACPACSLGAREWARLGSRFGCDPNTMIAHGLEPTRTLPHLCGLAAHLVTGEVVKRLSERESQALSDEELAYCQLSHRSWRTCYDRNASCPCPHEAWRVVTVGEGMLERSLRALAAELDVELRGMRAERPWFDSGICSSCGRAAGVNRFCCPGSAIAGTESRCPCGGTLIASPLLMASQVPAKTLHAMRDIPMSLLGLHAGDAIGLSDGVNWTYAILGQSKELP
jgi:hypothetical protein